MLLREGRKGGSTQLEIWRGVERKITVCTYEEDTRKGNTLVQVTGQEKEKKKKSGAMKWWEDGRRKEGSKLRKMKRWKVKRKIWKMKQWNDEKMKEEKKVKYK